MNARPLKVLLAIEDRQTLRQCARLLAAFGHCVSSAAAPELAAARLGADRPDMLVAGGASESALALLRAAVTDRPSQQIYKLLLVQDPTPSDVLKALEAGADDLVIAPLEPAELLTRVRTAARVLEFERRLGGLNQQDDTTGFLNRQSFLLRLQHELQAAQQSNATIACLVLQPDAYAELHELYGSPTAASALRELVQRIQQEQPQVCCGRIDEQRFALVLSAQGEEAHARAEQLRAAIAEAGGQAADAGITWTISVGLATGAGEPNVKQLIERSEKALLLAQQAGGNTVVRYEEEVVQEEHRWSELGGGRLFEGAVLRNIMVPFPRLLRTTDSLRQADAVLKQTRLAALPVVDDDGKLAGLLSANRQRPATETADTPVTQGMDKGPVSFDEATTLPVLIDYFTSERPPVVVVVHKGRPTGLVTPESLGTLVEPLSTSSFAPPREAAGRAGLIVPHLCIAD